MAEQAIESDPEILNKLLGSLGVPEKYKVIHERSWELKSIRFFKIVDILGTDAEDVVGIPGELKALLLVLPKDKFYEDSLAEKAATSEAEVYKVAFKSNLSTLFSDSFLESCLYTNLNKVCVWLLPWYML